jgi:hypothetical protein
LLPAAFLLPTSYRRAHHNGSRAGISDVDSRAIAAATPVWRNFVHALSFPPPRL